MSTWLPRRHWSNGCRKWFPTGGRPRRSIEASWHGRSPSASGAPTARHASRRIWQQGGLPISATTGSGSGHRVLEARYAVVRLGNGVLERLAPMAEELAIQDG